MKYKLQIMIFIVIVSAAIIVSRFSTATDYLTNVFQSFFNPVVNVIVDDVYKPYYENQELIEEKIIEFRKTYNLAAAGILFFHDIDLQPYFDSKDFYFSLIYEAVSPGLLPTHHIIKNVPMETMPDFFIRSLNECNGGEVGSVLTDPIFNILPERPVVACSISYKNRVYGMVYMVDFYDRRSLKELVSLTTELRLFSNEITEILNHRREK